MRAQVGKITRGARAIRLIRLLKVGKIAKTMKHHLPFATQNLGVAAEALKIFFTVLVLGHWFACLWVVMGDAGLFADASNSAKRALEERGFEFEFVDCQPHCEPGLYGSPGL